MIFKRRNYADITIRQMPLIIGPRSKDPELLSLISKVMISDCVLDLTYLDSLKSMTNFYFKLSYDYY